MKVLIIAPTSLRYCPYAAFYIDLLNEEGIDFDVVFPDKAKLNDKYSFSAKIYDWDTKKNKYLELINYRKYVLKLTKNEIFDFAIVLTTGLAVLFCSALRRRGIKYIADIRDYTHENLKPYLWIEKRSIRKSAGCVISSPGFRNFLPEYEYWDVFNTQGSLELKAEHFIKNNGNSPIRISYIGTIAYPDQCERLMMLVENDERFVFDLYGNDPDNDRISSYITKNNLKRIYYHGPYKPVEKGKIISNTDVLFNAYGNDRPLLLYALSNKLTDAAIYYKPVLNSPGTSMHEILGKCSFPIDLQNAINLDELNEWYMALEADVVEKKLNAIRETMINTNYRTKKKVLECIKKEASR